MPVDLGGQPVMLMWGNPEQIQAARDDLNALYSQVTLDCEQGLKRVGGWVKTKAMPSDRRQQIINDMIYNAKIRKLYRSQPPEGSHYPVVGIFVWPTQDTNSQTVIPINNPQTVLGMAFEGLDDIRFDHKVYILYDRKRCMFRVLGTNRKNVDLAVSRIHGTFCEVAAKTRRPTKTVLVWPLSMNLSATLVYYRQNHDLVNRQITVKRIEENRGIQVYLDGEPPSQQFLRDWEPQGEALKKANDQYLRKALGQAFQDTVYFRGHAKLRVYIGRLVLIGYKRPTDGVRYDFLEFCDSARDARITAEVIRSIGSARYGVSDSEAATELLDTLRQDTIRINALGLDPIQRRGLGFQPVDINPDPEWDGVSPEPQVSATFDLRLFGDKGVTHDIRLEVVFERLPGGGVYRPVHRRWLDASGDTKRATESSNRRKGPLDVKMVDLEADLACQIELSTWKLYKETELYPIFHEFVNRISVEHIPDEFHVVGPPAPGKPDERPTVRRISFANLPGLSVAGLVQKTKWRYWMGLTNYIFELTRYDNLPVHEVAAFYPEGVPVSYQGLDTPFDTRWGCCVWNDHWDEKLAQQAVVEIGNRGTWDTDVGKFFSGTGYGLLDDGESGSKECDEDGFTEFLDKVQEGIQLIKSARRNLASRRQPQAGSSRWHSQPDGEVGVGGG